MNGMRESNETLRPQFWGISLHWWVADPFEGLADRMQVQSIRLAVMKE